MIETMNQSHKAVTIQPMSVPNILLRLEGLAILVAAVTAYAHQGYSGIAFALLLLTPDLGMIGYLANPVIGSRTYNAVHFYALPLLLIALGLSLGAPIALQFGLIWCAHIGMDRLMGYGLKYPTTFKETHLGRV